jgi:hypothetical protein
MRAVTAAVACLIIALLVGMPAAMADPVLDGTLDGGDRDVDTDDHIVGEEMCAIPVRPRPWTVAPLDFGRLR